MSTGYLLSIVEIGGYPDFTMLYKSKGFQVDTANSMRKAIKILKRSRPDVIVAEFNFQSDFRDRTSSLESLMAAIQGYPDTRVIVFYEKEQRQQLDRLLAVYDVYQIMQFPVNKQQFEQILERIKQEIE
ncbi:MAG: hypothetical protein OEY61_06210 [Gammaproteobacteria bacterium]|nr:hypothetical protein [Gammaproteobacteria bacterium]